MSVGALTFPLQSLGHLDRSVEFSRANIHVVLLACNDLHEHAANLLERVLDRERFEVVQIVLLVALHVDHFENLQQLINWPQFHDVDLAIIRQHLELISHIAAEHLPLKIILGRVPLEVLQASALLELECLVASEQSLLGDVDIL